MRLLHDRYRSGNTDYFDLATGLEASVILGCWDIAREFLTLTHSASGEAWELETTANNLALLASTAPICDRQAVLGFMEALRSQPSVLGVGASQRLREPTKLALAIRCVVEMSHAYNAKMSANSENLRMPLRDEAQPAESAIGAIDAAVRSWVQGPAIRQKRE
jgi:hypothetical protein